MPLFHSSSSFLITSPTTRMAYLYVHTLYNTFTVVKPLLLYALHRTLKPPRLVELLLLLLYDIFAR